MRGLGGVCGGCWVSADPGISNLVAGIEEVMVWRLEGVLLVREGSCGANGCTT